MASPENTACYDVSSQTKDAVERDDWAEVARILSECSSRDLDSVMTQLVSRDQWDAVKQVIQCLNDDQLESALTVLVTQQQWKAAGLIVKRGVSNIQRRWAHEQCIQHGRGDEFQHFLPEGIHAGDEWVFLMKSLLSGFQGRDDDKRRLMSNITAGTRNGLLPRNMKEHLKDLLHALEQDLGSELDGVLYLCVRLTKPIFTELSQNSCCRSRYLKTCVKKIVTEDEFTHFVLPYLLEKHRNLVLTHLVRKHRWAAVDRVLQRGVSNDMHNWAVEECTKYADRDEFIAHVFPHFADDQRDSMLIHLVTRGQWKAVNTVLNRGVRNVRHNWAVEECSKKANSEDFIEYVLPHCADDQLVYIVLTHLVTRGQWKAVDRVLHRGVNNEDHRWAVEEGIKKAKSDDIIKYVLPHCAVDRLDSVMIHLVTRLHWRAVDKVLPQVVNKERRRWALKECSKKTTNDDFIKYILPHCADDELDCVLTHLETRGHWKAIDKVLSRGVSNVRHRWAVKRCSKKAESDDFIEYALPHCADDQLDSVLIQLVTRGQWKAVDRVLHRGVNNARHNWAVEECSKKAYSEDYIKEYVLPHCADDQLDSVLIQLVTRGQWKALDRVLHRGVNNARHNWAVEECSKKAYSEDYIEYVLPHCADDQLDSVLIQLVTRGQWKAVDRVLHRGVNNARHNWAVEECSKKAYSEDYIEYVLPHCADDQLDSVLIQLVTRGQWKAVDRVLHRGVNNARHNWAVEECSKKAYSEDYIECVLPHCADDQLDSVLIQLVTRGQWKAVDRVLHRGVNNARHNWAVEECSKSATSYDFIDYALLHLAYCYTSVLTHLVRRNLWEAVGKTLHQGMTTADDMWKTGTINQNKQQHLFLRYILPRDYAIVLPLLVEHGKLDLVGLVLDKVVASSLHQWVTGETRLPQGDEEASLNDVDNCHVDLMLTIRLFKAVLVVGEDGQARCSHLGLKEDLYEVLYMSLVHNVCVALCSDHNSLTHLNDPVDSCVPEIYHKIHSCMRNITVGCSVEAIIDLWNKQDSKLSSEPLGIRKHSSSSTHVFFQFLRQFNLYYRNRKEENDDDILLTMFAVLPLFPELQSVALRVMLRHKRWDVISHACLSHVWEQDRWQLLKAAVKQRQWSVVRKWADHTLYDDQRVWALNEARNEKQWDVALLLADNGLTDIEIMQVRYRVAKYADSKTSYHRALKAAVKKKAWRVVIQLVRLGMDKAKRGSFFSCMMRRRQWGVCRALLEQGLGVQVCLDALPHLLEMNQWTLVARVMEHGVDDSVRQLVMQRAWERREGSVVWLCIKYLPTPLSLEEQEVLFQRALSCEIWQVIKPLIEEKDETGIRHRDTALLEAIEQHQWDVVDHCQRHHADINMKDHDGHTPIHRAARKGDWEAVKELTVRDGDPNLLDREALSVLHRAIRAEQWDLVKLLIQFHGDIHLAERRYGPTPLKMLIDARQGEVIESSLMWCPDQQKVVNDKGETVLHAVCLSGWPGALHHLIARKVDPLVVTRRGLTALCYAVLCKDCSQMMVAECIRMGFNTHQPHMTAGYYRTEEQEMLISPLVLAVMRGLPVVTQMLYESRAYSNRQLRELSVHLDQLTKCNTDEGRKFRSAFWDLWKNVHNQSVNDPGYSFDGKLMGQSADYLREMCSTPRSLVSTCRLVISHCLTLSKTRHRDIAQLPLSPMIKDYLMFSDLTDPRYPDLSYRGKE